MAPPCSSSVQMLLLLLLLDLAPSTINYGHTRASSVLCVMSCCCASFRHWTGTHQPQIGEAAKYVLGPDVATDEVRAKPSPCALPQNTQDVQAHQHRPRGAATAQYRYQDPMEILRSPQADSPGIYPWSGLGEMSRIEHAHHSGHHHPDPSRHQSNGHLEQSRNPEFPNFPTSGRRGLFRIPSCFSY
ncbi:hypothetical protein F5884DRAFT_173667 [Xylogone sp. PMI_703]|nr:hypothetical protein F5884DRAFT_173667 [Xylogone sp. PMI_703]